uniref:Uncharacterized protein n=1 Tax=Peronospora matthiolae TaxID=2874970 RepID=A0AAV1USK0_9STRA
MIEGGTEVPIIGTTFAHKAGCDIDETQKQEHVDTKNNSYISIGFTKVKISSNGSLVFYFDIRDENQVGKEATL